MVGNNGINQSAISNVGATGKTSKASSPQAKSGLDALAAISTKAFNKAPEVGTNVSLASAEAVGSKSDHPAVLAA